MVLYAVLFYPTAYVLRNVRSVKAQKRLSHIAVFSAICGGITIAIALIIVLVNARHNPALAGEIIGMMLLVVLYVVLVLYAYRHIKNNIIYSDKPFSHAELKYVVDYKSQTVSGDYGYPAKYTYGMLAKVSMFFCPLMYLFAIAFIFGMIDQIFVSKSNANARIYKEDVQYAKDCVEQGYVALDAKDFTKAFDCFDRAAKLGYPEARLMLGMMYIEGMTVTPDYEKAFNLLTDGDVIVYHEAKFYVGMLYYLGEGTKQDFKQAGRYFQEAAQEGNIPAQKFLGYENGKMPDFGEPIENVLKRLWTTHPPYEKNKVPGVR